MKKVSNCCGKEDIAFNENLNYSDVGLCPECGEHCEFEDVPNYISRSLEVEIYDDRGRKFLVNWRSFSPTNNDTILIAYMSTGWALPIAYDGLRSLDSDLKANIDKAIAYHSQQAWNNCSVIS